MIKNRIQVESCGNWGGRVFEIDDSKLDIDSREVR